MKVTIWGARGSFPNTMHAMSRYGGNTTCIEVKTDAGDTIILDAGTGIRELGKHLCATQDGGECAICFTHSHWDHVNGLISFTPLYSKEWHISIYGPRYVGNLWKKTFETLFNSSHFPLVWENIEQYNSLSEFCAGDSFNVGSAFIETCATNHPGGGVAYKITADGWTFFFSGDHEWGEVSSAKTDALQDFMHGVNVVLGDSHFTEDAYQTHKGWGHSTMNQWIDHALKADVHRLIFTHFHPDYTDNALEKCMDALWREHIGLSMQMMLAREGMCIKRDGEYSPLDSSLVQSSCDMCDFSHKVSRYADSGLILESVLTEARRIGKADAGTVYLIKDIDQLAFAYAQNETLFPGSAANKMTYLNATVELNKDSIAGYVAITGTPLNIADVRCLPKNVPYSFNDSFDKSTGYLTISMITIPLIGSHSEVVGVLQLINSQKDGKSQLFTSGIQNKLELLAIAAADSIERSRLSNELIMRMLETSALRDPTETAGHVMRVGAMAAEIYHCWAEKRGIPPDELRTIKDTIRMAAMLHDVGKVGVPDAVLKKPGKLTAEEFAVIKTHCIMGAGLFKDPSSRLDIMAYNIALHHHQKYNGKGYTGDDSTPCLSGMDIPLEARITAVADVYDALVSVRCYKEPMPVEVAIDILQKDSGSHFDPEIIDAFMEIKAVIFAISERFND